MNIQFDLRHTFQLYCAFYPKVLQAAFCGSGRTIRRSHRSCCPARGRSDSSHSTEVLTATWLLWCRDKSEVTPPASQADSLVQEHCLKEVRLLSISWCGVDVPFMTPERGKSSPGWHPLPLLYLFRTGVTRTYGFHHIQEERNQERSGSMTL